MNYPRDIRSLTPVRFFAALWVVMFHWRANWAVDVDSFTGVFEMGRLGVDIFFVLSGFVLAHVYFAKVRMGNFDYWQFLIARLARIYPLHIIVFGFVGAMIVGSTLLGVPTQSEAFPPGHILPNLLLVQAWGFTPGPTWNVPAWSISAEWFAYLLFPVFALIGLKFMHRPVWGIVLGLILFFAFDQLYLVLVGSPLPSATDNFGTLRILPEFLMGFMLYLFGQKYSLRTGWIRVGAVTSTIIAIVLAAHWRLDERIIALLALPLVFFLAELSKGKQISGGRQSRRYDPFEYLGRVSYSIYLLHVPFFMAAYNLMDDVFGWVDGPLSTPLMLALLIVFLLVSVMSYHYVENPARDFVRKQGNLMIIAFRHAFSGASLEPEPSLTRINKKDVTI